MRLPLGLQPLGLEPLGLEPLGLEPLGLELGAERLGAERLGAERLRSFHSLAMTLRHSLKGPSFAYEKIPFTLSKKSVGKGDSF